MTEYTQGICKDGAAILKDGVPMTPEEILEHLIRAESTSNDSFYLQRYTEAGQIQIGDLILASDGNEIIHTKVERICNADTNPEIILRKRVNHYFISSMYFAGESWIKHCYIVRKREKGE